MLLQPAEAGNLLGISRQAVCAQRSRLDASGQGQTVEGRWLVESENLIRWWVGHCRVGAQWNRLRRIRQLLGPAEIEARILAAGGLQRLEDGLQLLAALAPAWSIDTTTVEVIDPNGCRAPLAAVHAAWSSVVLALGEQHGGPITANDEGVLLGPEGQELGHVWQWQLEPAAA